MFNGEFKNALSYTSSPAYIFMAWYLVKRRNNFSFTLPSCSVHSSSTCSQS